jgi:pantoate--beta-alanine ligase
MKVTGSIAEIRALSRQWHTEGERVGLVPTMGYLHEGHLSLVQRSRELADRTVVSIFVNPTQFGPGEDLDTYPRDLDRDLELCSSEQVDAVFIPSADTFYAPGHSTWVEETALSKGLCGGSRPRHFRGVTTVVTKLFNAVQPDLAVFGRKDAQQALVIQRMVRDLDIPVEIHLGDIIREADGVAMSSRNARLNEVERVRARALNHGLKAAGGLCESGERRAAVLLSAVEKALREADAEIDYVELVGLESLQPVSELTAPALLAVAVRIGATRLIDNCILRPRG